LAAEVLVPNKVLLVLVGQVLAVVSLPPKQELQVELVVAVVQAI
jgi:hypothetical protein